MKIKLPFFEAELSELERIWHMDIALLVVSVFLLLLGYEIGNLIFKEISFLGLNSWSLRMLLGDFFMASGYMFWILGKQYPKVDKGKIGIVIAIRDNTPQAKKIKADVIDKFCTITENLPIANKIQILSVKDFIAEKATNKVNAREVLGECRGHFIVYGNTLNYTVKNNEQYEFDLSFLVRHKPLESGAQTLLQTHFNESLLNKQWKFLEGNPFEIIKATADNIREIALYVIGIASFLSSDFDTSLNFHKTVLELLDKDTEKKKALSIIYKRLAGYISDAQMILGIKTFYSNPDDINVTQSAKELNDEALRIMPNHYPALVNEAKYLFQLGDIEGAKKVIKKIRKLNNKSPRLVTDSSWRYSEAFLLFHNEEFEKGRKSYRIAFNGYVNDFTLVSVADFLEKYVKENPDRIQFLYVLGICYYHSRDTKFSLALKHFEEFSQKAGKQEKYKLLMQETNNCISYIKKEIGY